MFQAIDFAGNQPFNDWFSPDNIQRHPLGLTVKAVDPWWGGAEFIYIAAQSTMEKGSLVQITAQTITVTGSGQTFGLVASDLPNTANLGRNFAVLMNSMISGQYGWAQLSGLAVLSAQASVAADTAIGVAAAGQVGANSAGKQLLGTRNVYASANTLVKANTLTKNASAVLVTSGYDGWFLGMALSGTGIPASTVVAKLDPDGRTVYTGSAIGTVGDKNATASGSVSVTGTWTGYIGTYINHPFAQGAIT